MDEGGVRAIGRGRFFGPEGRVELIEGIVYDMSPQKSLHAAGVRLVEGR